MELLYAGLRLGSKDQPLHRYDDPAGELPPVYFKKKLGKFTRTGDVIEVERDGDTFKMTSAGAVRHVDSPQLAAESQASWDALQAIRLDKKLARKSDLEEAIRPLKSAYLRLPDVHRAAMLTWVVRKIMSWG